MRAIANAVEPIHYLSAVDLSQMDAQHQQATKASAALRVKLASGMGAVTQ